MVSKVEENRWRQAAERRGWRLEKSRQRDPQGFSFGKYKLHPVLREGWHTAEEVVAALTAPAPRLAATMSFEEYRAKTGETAVYPECDKAYPATAAVTYLALGLAGETGETVDVIKKQLRKGGSWTDETFRELLMGEMGDVMWYFTQLCDTMDFDFGMILQQNIDKLAGRKAKGTLKERVKPEFHEAPDLGPTYNKGGILPPGQPLYFEGGGCVVSKAVVDKVFPSVEAMKAIQELDARPVQAQQPKGFFD